MTSPMVAITGLGLWMPGYPSVDRWVRGEKDPETTKPIGRAFDRVNRRRAGRLGRAIADVVAEAIEEAAVDPATVATVVGSSIGEASPMIGLLDQLWRKKEPMSPAAFTVSVHNAASGLLSISSKNRGYTTSLAADENTPAAALLEAIGLVSTTGRPAVVVCADEEAPRRLLRAGAPWQMVAAAVVLAPPDSSENCRARMRVSSQGVASIAPAAVDELMIHNPQIGLVDLVDAVLRGSAGSVALDRGRGRGYLADLVVGGT